MTSMRINAILSSLIGQSARRVSTTLRDLIQSPSGLCGDGPELLHEAEQVGYAAFFDDLPIIDAVDADPVPLVR